MAPWLERWMAETSVTLAYRLIFAAILVGCAYLAWLHFSKPPAVGTSAPAKVAPEIRKIPKVDLHPRVVRVYQASANKELGIADNVHVVESTKIEPDTNPHTITTVLNADTGEFSTIDRRDPLPWLQLKRSGALGLEHDLFRGVDTIYVRQDFIQAKSLVLGGKLAFNSERNLAGTVSLEWRW